MTFLQFSKKSSAASGGGDLRRHHANKASEFAARAGFLFARRCGLRPDRDVHAPRPIGGPSGRAQGQACYPNTLYF